MDTLGHLKHAKGRQLGRQAGGDAARVRIDVTRPRSDKKMIVGREVTVLGVERGGVDGEGCATHNIPIIYP